GRAESTWFRHKESGLLEQSAVSKNQSRQCHGAESEKMDLSKVGHSTRFATRGGRTRATVYLCQYTSQPAGRFGRLCKVWLWAPLLDAWQPLSQVQNVLY